MESVCCELQYSRAGTALVCAAAWATASVAAALPIGAGWRLGLLAWVAGHAALALRALQDPVRLRLSRGGELEVERRAGGARRGTVRPGSFVAPWLVAIRWRPQGARFDRTLLVLPGMAPARALRNIRVIVRWG